MNVQTTYNIFDWFARRNTIIAGNLDNKADQANIDKARNDVALVVANSFLQVMLRREQARISEVQMNQSKSQLALTQKLVAAGSQPELNAIQIEAQLAKDSSMFVQSQALVEQALINLKASINYDFAIPFDIEAPNVESISIENITDLQPEAVYAIALENQPAQKMYKLRIEAGQYYAKAARANMYPALTAFGNLNTRAINSKTTPVFAQLPDQQVGYATVNGTKVTVFAPNFAPVEFLGTPFFNQVKNNFGQAVGLSLNFSIFNNHTARAQYERTKVDIDRLTLQVDQENLTLKTNIYNAYQDAYSSLQKLNASKRTVEYSQRALDMARKRYNIGLLGTLDFIITQNNLYLAQIDEISNRYDYVFKMKVLEFYKGQGIRL
jgi:outer membrane protein